MRRLCRCEFRLLRHTPLVALYDSIKMSVATDEQTSAAAKRPRIHRSTTRQSPSAPPSSHPPLSRTKCSIQVAMRAFQCARISFLLLAALLFHVGQTCAQSCTHSRTIVKGDTCDSIAQVKQCSNAQLLYLNPTIKCSSLPVGTKICTATAEYDCQPVVQVKSGDSCSAIASAAGITVAQLQKDNPGLNCNAIYPGQMVCVATLAPGQTAPASTSSAPQPTATTHGACTHSRTIQQGDTCDSIATAKGVSRYQLQRVNPGLNCNNLHVGDKICTATAEYDCQPVDSVVSGDTCYAMATRHTISVDQLLTNNPGLDCDALYVGQVLCAASIAPGQTPTSTTATSPSSTTSAVPSPTSTACTDYSTVRSGDDCDVLGRRFSLTRPDLLRLNGGRADLCETLIAGEGICVEGPLRKCGETQEVQAGDTCYDLAQESRLSLSDFYAINSDVGEDCATLYPGQTICTGKRTDYGSGSSGECSLHTTIRVGDTCERIAARASLTSLQLRGLNPGMNCSEIIIGEELCSYAQDISLCPEPKIIKFNDTCYDLSVNASMSLQEWTNVQSYGGLTIDCDALPLSHIVCQARGNASLPALSGDNPGASPRCSSACDYKTSCCSAYSVCMPLASEYCAREEGVSRWGGCIDSIFRV